MSMNQDNLHIATGVVGQNPELATTGQGKDYCKFSIALSKQWKDKATGETKKSVTWMNYVVYDNTARFVAQYVKKGDVVSVASEVANNSYQKDGVTVNTYEFRVNDVRKRTWTKDNVGENTTDNTTPDLPDHTGVDEAVPF